MIPRGQPLIDDILARSEDQFVEVTCFGSERPEYLMGYTAADTAIPQLREAFAYDLISLEQFEQAVETVYGGTT